MIKKLSKLLLVLSLLCTGIMFTPKVAYANEIETRGIQIQMAAEGEYYNKTHTYNGVTIYYDVNCVGTYVVDQNNNILSTNIGATTETRPDGSKLQAYVRGCSTTISGKIATTTVIVGFKFNGSIIIDTKSYTFKNSVN